MTLSEQGGWCSTLKRACQCSFPVASRFSLQVSTPERAVLEWIAVTPNELLFGSELVDTFGGLNTLRPRRASG